MCLHNLKLSSFSQAVFFIYTSAYFSDQYQIHLAVDAHGNPIRFIITDGVTHDVKAAPDLIDTLDLSDVAILGADKGYDSQCFREKVEESQTIANMPRKRNTKLSNVHMDWHLYKSRHLVENAFCRIKHYRGIATRYEKLKRNYENLVALAFAYHWLKL
ncbi:IS5 family transposase [Moraxella osloensis]|uniref:IS5 family transposase n=1 Tax=Faucicola osloensis TaxID=34062 RepID=A0AAW6TJW0_FAUOS|nr:IS5 family transposase [Moraxella osloensis]